LPSVYRTINSQRKPAQHRQTRTPLHTRLVHPLFIYPSIHKTISKMKSASIAIAALASAAIAQPHGHARRHHHDKRDLYVEWVTVEETVTVEIDEFTTQTFYPSQTREVVTTSSNSPGQFFQGASSSTSSAAAPVTTLVVKPSTEQTIAAVPTTTSLAPVVVPTTTAAQAPTTTAQAPTTTAEAPTTTAQAPTTAAAAATESTTYAAASATSSTTGSESANVKDTDMTYYTIGLGSCGFDDSGLDLTKPVVAIDSSLWDSVSTATSYGLNEPAHPFCNQEITIKYNGQTTTGIVRDRCAGCVKDAIDVSEMIFDDLVGGTGAGRVQVEWYFNNGKW
jgi:hypothetical protein